MKRLGKYQSRIVSTREKDTRLQYKYDMLTVIVVRDGQ
jgi:hypothetical protein